MKRIAHRVLKWYMRSFPMSKGKARALALLWRPLSFGQYRRQTTLRQANIRINCDLTQFIQRHLYFYGGYEEQQCQRWVQLARDARTVFDIGANVGLYSLLAAAANSKASVHAFEPTPGLVTAMLDHIELNDFHNISVNPVAVGRASGQGFLHFCTGRDDSNEGMNFVTGATMQDGDMPIGIVSVDDYCRQEQIEQIDLLKLDIEGGEFDVLLGARDLLRTRAIGCIFLELAEWTANRSGHSTVDVKRLLSEAGYRIYRLSSGGLTEVQAERTHSSDNVIALARERGLL